MPQKASSRIFILTVVFFLLTGLFIILLVNIQMRREALREAEIKAQLLLNRNLATHTYFSRQLKPALFKIMGEIAPEGYFDPVWMSSTYAVREMVNYTRSPAEGDFYYKECAVNARSPQNEADALETGFIHALNQNRALEVSATERTIGGVPFFVVLRRGEVMEQACLRCHSTPAKAPAGLIEKYGPQKSFDRHVGEVISAISIRIPLASAYMSANRLSLKLSMMLLLVLFILYIATWLTSRALIFRPLQLIQEKTKRILSAPQRLGEQIPLPHGRELKDLTLAFNQLSADLRRERDLLEEKVKAKTCELVSANQELSSEIAERKQAEHALRESEVWFRNIYEKSPIGIELYDREGRLIQANEACLEIFGIAEFNVVKGFNLFRDPNFPPEHLQQLRQGRPVQYEFSFDFEKIKKLELYATRKTGVIHLDVRITPLVLNGTDAVDGYLAQVVDLTTREEAKKALAASEERLKLALESVSDAVWDWRIDTGEVYHSPRWFTMLGYAPEELSLTAETWQSLVHPDDLPHAQQVVREHFTSGEPFEYELRMRTRDGHWKWILARGKTVERNAQGRAARMLGTNMDVTVRKRDESEREIMFHLLQALHQENDLSGLIRDVLTLMQNWSDCAAVGIRLQEGEDFPYYETKGFPPRFVNSERWLCAKDKKGELIRDSEGNPVLECMCGNVIRGRFNPELPFFTQFGSFWTNSTTDLISTTSIEDRLATTRNRCQGEGYASVALIPLKVGHQRLGLLQFNDPRPNRFDQQKITLLERLASSLAIGLSQRMSDLALRESEEKYRSMMASMEDAVYICSPDFLIEYMNPAMIKRIGRDATGEICHSAIYGLAAQCPWCVHAKVLAGERISSEVFSAKDHRTCHVSNSPVCHTDGSVSTLTVLRDVTEFKRMEILVQQAQKMESIGNLAGGIAHDFNNLLFPIVGMAEMLMEDLPADSLPYENAQEILKAGKRGGDLVKQILAFSRQTEHKVMPVRIQQILKEVFKLSRATIPSDIEIAQHIRADCGPVLADPTQLHQIAMNLITNACHAVEGSGGKITLALSEAAISGGESPECILEPGQYAKLTVSDTGCGISPDIINRIFDPYFTAKPRGKGTGLGLAVVYGIVKAYGGDIRVQSEVGRGSTFDIYLPLTRVSNAQEKNEAAGKARIYSKGTERILLVDDEAAVAQLENQMIARLGYQVTVRTSSPDALATFMADPHAFDLILTDMNMPNMNGVQLSRELIAIRPDIPIIICTGFSERVDKEIATAIGIKDFLLKPIVRFDLAQAVRRVLDESKSASDLK